MNIRGEQPGDEAAIADVTAAAFAPMAFSDQSEPQIIARLRSAGALTMSLVAEMDGVLIGHIAFSPVSFSGGESDWFALGPIAVRPARQGTGIGSALVEEGLSRLRSRGAGGCILAGSPRYYHRFGFAAVEGLTSEGVPPQYLLVLPLRAPVPSGIVRFHPGFYGGAM